MGETPIHFTELLELVWPFGRYENSPLGAIPLSYLEHHYDRLDNGWLKWRVSDLLNHPKMARAFVRGTTDMTPWEVEQETRELLDAGGEGLLKNDLAHKTTLTWLHEHWRRLETIRHEQLALEEWWADQLDGLSEQERRDLLHRHVPGANLHYATRHLLLALIHREEFVCQGCDDEIPPSALADGMEYCCPQCGLNPLCPKCQRYGRHPNRRGETCGAETEAG